MQPYIPMPLWTAHRQYTIRQIMLSVWLCGGGGPGEPCCLRMYVGAVAIWLTHLNEWLSNMLKLFIDITDSGQHIQARWLWHDVRCSCICELRIYLLYQRWHMGTPDGMYVWFREKRPALIRTTVYLYMWSTKEEIHSEMLVVIYCTQL